jgi:hypothetical protein
MKDRKLVEEKLMHAGKRRRWQRSWMGLWKGFFWGALLWLTTLIVFKLLPVPFEVLAWSANCMGDNNDHWVGPNLVQAR